MSSEAAAIAQRVAEYLEAMTERRDADAAAGFYTKDARLLGPGMDMGRTDVLRFLTELLDAGVEVEVDRHTLELFVHGDVAYELAQADDTLRFPDGTKQVMRNNLFIRWEREPDAAWRFARVLLSPREGASP